MIFLSSVTIALGAVVRLEQETVLFGATPTSSSLVSCFSFHPHLRHHPDVFQKSTSMQRHLSGVRLVALHTSLDRHASLLPNAPIGREAQNGPPVLDARNKNGATIMPHRSVLLSRAKSRAIFNRNGCCGILRMERARVHRISPP